MYSYIIDGGNRLVGETYVSGSKNASLPILAATIISGKISKLYNVPNIEDVNITLKILESLGCKIRRTKEFVLVDSSKIDNTAIPDELMRKLRSSVVIVGALIARFKNAYFSYPGGCDNWRIHLTDSRYMLMILYLSNETGSCFTSNKYIASIVIIITYS